MSRLIFLVKIKYFRMSSAAVVTDTLTLCMLGNFACFFSRLWIFFFFKLTLSKKSFRNTMSMSNSLDPDQARQNVGPDLGPNCSQRFSADDKSHH